jgi:8-oxo-dGTP pyrophosphatase MutT (NUDIX family)
VVLRGDEVVVIVPRGRPDRLALPKGWVEPGERSADAAAREVREEAGVEAELVEKLGDVRYWYQRGGARVLKNVAFFMFRYRSGDPADHDHEVEDARWMPLSEAVAALSFKGEREMAAEALSRLHGER